MSLNRYFNEIESLQFQIQFSVVGGLKILQLAMGQHATLRDLISVLETDRRAAKRVFQRIRLLLEKVETETELSYDESIAAYLFCLWKTDPATARDASKSILEAGGQWWSIQLALHILQQVQVETA